MHLNKYHLPSGIQQQQSHYLQMKNGLSQLFDKFDAMRLFQITQDSVEVNLDNITFGPSQQTITFTNKEDLYFKIIYYSILYFIFQKKYDQKSNKAYQNLLQFIFQNEIVIGSLEVELSQDQIKVYLTKFLRILQTAKTRRNVVFDELNSIPQISIILVLLIKQMVKQQKLVFQKNARSIQNAIVKQLQLNFDLLSCQLFLFGGEFKIEIRQFNRNCQFMIVHEKEDQIQRIKQQFYLAESAYFKQQGKNEPYTSFETALSTKKTSAKIIKKSTMKSIQWSEDESQGKQMPNQMKLECMKEYEEEQYTSQIQDCQEATQDVLQINVNNHPLQEIKMPNSIQITKTSSKDQDYRLNFPNLTTRCPINKLKMDTREFACSSNNFHVIRHKNHKQSFDSSHLSAFNFNTKELTISKSTKQIKNEDFEKSTEKNCFKQRRVPSFILNRVRQKQLKTNAQRGQRIKITDVYKANFPKITFSYSFK